MNGVPLQTGMAAPPLPPVVANPVPIGQVPQIPDESAFLHAPAPAMPDMSGLSKFGASVKNIELARGRAVQRTWDVVGTSRICRLDERWARRRAPSVLAGAYGTPPPFGGVPVPTAPTAAPTPPLDTQGGP